MEPSSKELRVPEKQETKQMSPQEKRAELKKKLKGKVVFNKGSIKLGKPFKAQWEMSSNSAPLQLKLPQDYKPPIHRKSMHINTEKLQKLLEPQQIQKSKSPAQFANLQGFSSAIEKSEKVFSELYELGEVIGQGSTAVVKKCKNKLTQKEYAVKVVRTTDQEVIKIIEQEFKIVSSVPSHPNILKVHELFQDGEKSAMYTVMELIDGDELASIIEREKNLSEARAKGLFKQIIQGILHLHQHGVVHRDISPSNVMVQQNGIVKLMDFNVSKRCSLRDGNKNFNGFSPLNYSMHTHTGTPSFNAPELIRGDFYYSEVVDEWSAGCVLYMMLTGFQPFYSDSLAELVKMIEMGEYDLSVQQLQKASIEVKDLLRKLLQVKLSKRMTALQALKSPWFESSSQIFEDQKI